MTPELAFPRIPQGLWSPEGIVTQSDSGEPALAQRITHVLFDGYARRCQ